MFFEMFTWEEEKLGLISGVSFVLIGVFAYLIYTMSLSLNSIVFMVLGMLASSGTAIFFQLPRIRGTRAAISTFLGGMMIGGAIIFWVISGVSTPADLLNRVIIFALTGVEIFLVFFAVGFLVLALYPEGAAVQSSGIEPANSPASREEKNESQVDDFLERL